MFLNNSCTFLIFPQLYFQIPQVFITRKKDISCICSIEIQFLKVIKKIGSLKITMKLTTDVVLKNKGRKMTIARQDNNHLKTTENYPLPLLYVGSNDAL